MYLADLR